MIASDLKTRRETSEAARPAHLDADILAGILGASSDACWCMEFGQPVDITAPDHEIVRQVFENDPYWRLTNPAMARLYLLEPDMDFDQRPVAEIFPHNPQNEAFVLNLIANGFEVDAAPALDTRYDGVSIYVENDVRAHIRDGQLLRMFGIVRDVGKHRRREERMRAELNEALDILTALPHAVLAFDEQGAVMAANPTAARLLGRPADDLLGRAVADLGGGIQVAAALDAVLGGGPPIELSEAGLRWSLAPRGTAGAVACLRKADNAVGGT